MFIAHRFPHDLRPVVLTGTAKGKGKKARQERITPEDKFLSIDGFTITVVTETTHLVLYGLLVTNHFRARRNHGIDSKSPVPAELMAHDTHTSILRLMRALNNTKATHGSEEMRVITVGRYVTELWNTEIELPNHPSPVDAKAWRLRAEKARAILGNVTNRHKVEAAEELLRLAEVEKKNARRTSLMLRMAETRLSGRLDDIAKIDIKVSRRMYNVVRLFNGLCDFTAQIQRVARQAVQVYGPSSTSTTPEGMRNAIRYWRDHAEELESCVIEPFRTQFQPIAVCFRKAADALERLDTATVVFRMEQIDTLCGVIGMTLDIESVLSPLSALRHADQRKVDPTLPHEVQWRKAEMMWARAQLADVYRAMVQACARLNPIVGNDYTVAFLSQVTSAGKALRDNEGSLTALDRAYEALNFASLVLEEHITLPD